MPVPMYIEFDEGIFRLGSVTLVGNATCPEFKITLPRKPKRVLLNAYHDILNAENVVVVK